MRVVKKSYLVTFGMILAVLATTTKAADPVPATGSPAPGYTFPPSYPGGFYPIPYYRPLAQNPYLPALVPAPRPWPPNAVYPWPFFMMLPPLPARPPAATVPVPTLPTPVPEASPPVASSQAPRLTQEAELAFAKARADIEAARASSTLWVPAENAWKAAKDAARVGDSDAVLTSAKAIADLTGLGAAQAQYPATKTAPELTQAAKLALAQAEADVQVARAEFTLWVPAENAFKAAQEAAKTGDSATVLKLGKEIAELTRLGAEQARYPSTEVAATPVEKRKAKPVTKPKARVKRVATKPTATSTVKKPEATGSGAKAAVQTPAKAISPAAAGGKPAAAGNAIMPRKLCWQGDRLVECP